MKFNLQEQKLVERLRKQERSWRFTRWILLLGGLLTSVMWGWVLWFVYRSVESEQPKDAALMLSFAYPKVLFGQIAAAAMIGFALRDWWGHPTRLLLLKLIEERQGSEVPTDQTAQPAASPNSRPPSQLPALPEVQSSDSLRTHFPDGCG